MIDPLLFGFPKINPDELSPAVWAYIGDAVYELFIRCYLLSKGPAKTKSLHHEAINIVRASFQAEAIKILEPELTDEELELFKRGRNIKSGHIPANSDVITYRVSTGFEALIGYLYLCGRHDRLMELLKKTVDITVRPNDSSSGETDHVKS